MWKLSRLFALVKVLLQKCTFSHLAWHISPEEFSKWKRCSSETRCISFHQQPWSEFITFALKDFESSLIYCTSRAQSVPLSNNEGHCLSDGPFFFEPEWCLKLTDLWRISNAKSPRSCRSQPHKKSRLIHLVWSSLLFFLVCSVSGVGKHRRYCQWI